MFLLSAGIEWYEIAGLLLGGSGLTTIIIFGLKWIRERKADVQDVNIKKANVDKIAAEATEARARADVGVADAALRWAEKLTLECNKTREQLDKSEKDLEVALNSLRDATIKMSEAQHDLKNERQKNIFMSAEVEKLHAEIERLKQQQKQ